MAGLTGVFGGTFDPPHIGHMNLALSSMEDFGLEKVLWVLTHNPPHKPDDPISALESRNEMLLAAIAQFPYFELSRIDIDRPGPHFAVGTMRGLREANPETRYAYLMGEDSLRDLPTWHEPAEFVGLCDMLGVMHRSHIQVDLDKLEELLPGIRSKVRYSCARQLEVSATDIRLRVREDLPYEHLVPPQVAQIIQELELYK
jgi:nicotinate-nucleotide adenylyltransferase